MRSSCTAVLEQLNAEPLLQQKQIPIVNFLSKLWYEPPNTSYSDEIHYRNQRVKVFEGSIHLSLWSSCSEINEWYDARTEFDIPANTPYALLTGKAGATFIIEVLE